ncbi:MAG: zinc-dependent metalloprotease, partial [Gemmatimonadota bacterium]
GRASVMDYPYMYVKLDANGKIDLSDAYATGIGAWDKVSIMYGYSEFPSGTNEDSALDAILHNAWSNGLTFLTDQDARPAGSAEPQTHLWDNGKDAAAELNRLMKVRRVALDRFGEAAIREGRPLATMEDALVPIYLFHRYQVVAASKTLGGLYYTFAMRGDGQQPLHRPSAAEQKEALDALLNTLDPAQLALPQGILNKLPPRPFTYPATRELFNRYTGLVFDAVSPAAAAADITVSMILQPERAARLIEQHDFDSTLPGLDQVIDRLFDATYGIKPANGYQAEIERAVRRVVADRLMDLAAGADMPQVRAIAALKLRQLRDRLTADARRSDVADRAADLMSATDIGRFLDRPMAPEKMAQPVAPPPGDPIGSGEPAGPPPTRPLD